MQASAHQGYRGTGKQGDRCKRLLIRGTGVQSQVDSGTVLQWMTHKPFKLLCPSYYPSPSQASVACSQQDQQVSSA